MKAKLLEDLIFHRKGRVTSKYQAEEENTILPILETTTKTIIRIEIIRRKKIKVFEIKFICNQQDLQLKKVRGKKKERCHIQNQHSKKKEEKESNKINSMSKENEEYYIQKQLNKKKEEKESNKTTASSKEKEEHYIQKQLFKKKEEKVSNETTVASKKKRKKE